MAEPFIGQISLVGFNYAPRGWALCNGQILPIAQNTALFSLLGTTFGGDGETTFGLPDLRGRTPVHPGTGPGLSTIFWGQKGGVESQTLSVDQLPPHTHAARCLNGPGDANTAKDNVWSGDAGNQSATYNSGIANADMGSSAIGPTGLGQPIDNRSPFSGVYYIIALIGIFPSPN